MLRRMQAGDNHDDDLRCQTISQFININNNIIYYYKWKYKNSSNDNL